MAPNFQSTDYSVELLTDTGNYVDTSQDIVSTNKPLSCIKVGSSLNCIKC